MRKCKSCGTPADKDAKFCTACGKKLKSGQGVLITFVVAFVVLFLIGIVSSEGVAEQPELTPAISETEFKSLCQEVNYKDLLRNPHEHRGEKVVVEVLLVQEASDGDWRAYSDGSVLGDEYYIEDVRTERDFKMLVEDVVRVYGTYNGVKKITRALTGTTDEVPWIRAEYIELIAE